MNPEDTLPPNIAELPVVERFAALIDGLCAMLLAELAPRTWVGAVLGWMSRPLLGRLCADLRKMSETMRALAAEVGDGVRLGPWAADGDESSTDDLAEGHVDRRACPRPSARQDATANGWQGMPRPPDISVDQSSPCGGDGAGPEEPSQAAARAERTSGSSSMLVSRNDFFAFADVLASLGGHNLSPSWSAPGSGQRTARGQVPSEHRRLYGRAFARRGSSAFAEDDGYRSFRLGNGRIWRTGAWPDARGASFFQTGAGAASWLAHFVTI